MSMVGHLRGQTFHSRKGAVANTFRHAVDYVLLDPEPPVKPVSGHPDNPNSRAA